MSVIECLICRKKLKGLGPHLKLGKEHIQNKVKIWMEKYLTLEVPQ